MIIVLRRTPVGPSPSAPYDGHLPRMTGEGYELWAKLTHPDLGKIVPDPAQPRSIRSGAVVEERVISFVEGLVITAVMPTYGRKDVVFERGEGNYLYRGDGRRYFDLTSGISANALAHS